jgi:hypothetical protein
MTIEGMRELLGFEISAEALRHLAAEVGASQNSLVQNRGMDHIVNAPDFTTRSARPCSGK